MFNISNLMIARNDIELKRIIAILRWSSILSLKYLPYIANNFLIRIQKCPKFYIMMTFHFIVFVLN